MSQCQHNHGSSIKFILWLAKSRKKDTILISTYCNTTCIIFRSEYEQVCIVFIFLHTLTSFITSKRFKSLFKEIFEINIVLCIQTKKMRNVWQFNAESFVYFTLPLCFSTVSIKIPSCSSCKNFYIENYLVAALVKYIPFYFYYLDIGIIFQRCDFKGTTGVDWTWNVFSGNTITC